MYLIIQSLLYFFITALEIYKNKYINIFYKTKNNLNNLILIEVTLHIQN